MPNSSKTTNTHAINVLVAVVTNLCVSFRTFLGECGVESGPVIQQLLDAEAVLPTLLNLKDERITDTELAALAAEIQSPVPTPAPVVPATPPGVDDANWDIGGSVQVP